MVSRFFLINIITYIGYCDGRKESGDTRFYGKDHAPSIVFEYPINGSLLDHLQDPDKRHSLTWVKRLKICIGAARGLKCLHFGIQTDYRVVHKNVNSECILLDANMEAKVSFLEDSIKVSKIKRESDIDDVKNQGAAASTTTIQSRQNQKLEDLLIPLNENNLATGNFNKKSKIGKGGFSQVYKGQLSNGWSNHQVAIKRLSKKGPDVETEFRKSLN
ncbi:protein kinase, ATP binding site-containing protein [Tanacetum coccineum]